MTEVSASREYRFEGCRYVPERRELRYGGVRFTVPLQESKVLCAMLERPGSVVSKTELAAILWPQEQYGDFDRAIHNLVSKVRRLHPQAPQWIETIPKTGYRWTPPVSVEEQQAVEPAGEAFELIASPAPKLAVLSAVNARGVRRRRIWPSAAMVAALLIGVVVWILWRRSAVSAPQTVVIGVLPLAVTGAAAGEPDTLREELADSMAAVPHIEVRAAHSLPSQLKGQEDLQRIVRELHIDFLVAGTLDLRPADYTLNLELIRASDGSHIASRHYEGTRAGLGSLADRAASDMTPLLRSGSTREGTQRALGSTTNDQAYDLAFRAGTALMQRDRASVDRAQQLYRQALALDPRFTHAWAGLAESELVEANFGDSSQSGALFEAARKDASRALELDALNAQAHSTLGLILLQHDWDLPQAEQQLRLAAAANPGLAANHLHMAVLFTDEGLFKEAQNEIALASQLDPAWPIIKGTALYVHIMARQYGKGIEDGKALVAARPDWSRAHEHLGWAYWYSGLHAQAIDEWERAARLDGNESLTKLESTGGQILERHGVRAYAEYKIAAAAKGLENEDFVAAEWNAFAGHKEQTLDSLEQMVSSHNPESLKIPWNPAYDFVRDQPRFKALVPRICPKAASR